MSEMVQTITHKITGQS